MVGLEETRQVSGRWTQKIKAHKKVLTEWMLGLNGFLREQWLTRTHDVFSHHTEFVLRSDVKTTDCGRGRRQESAHL